MDAYIEEWRSDGQIVKAVAVEVACGKGRPESIETGIDTWVSGQYLIVAAGKPYLLFAEEDVHYAGPYYPIAVFSRSPYS